MRKIIISGMVFSCLASSVIVGIVLYSSTPSKPYGINSASAATVAQAMQKITTPASEQDSQNQLKEKTEMIAESTVKKEPEVKPEIKSDVKAEPFSGLNAFQTTLPYNQLTATVPYPSHENTVYLTFDDGPSDSTKEIVEILDKNQIHGSFFWIGNNLANWLEKDPTNKDFVHQMLGKGEVIGSHTMAHTALAHHSLASQEQLIKDSVNFISERIGKPITYFRPPYGSVDGNTYKAAESAKQAIAYWKVDSEDWKYPNNPTKVLSNITSEVVPGAIILMHEKPTTAAMLQTIIDTLKEKGYEFAPLPTLPVTSN